MFLHIEWARVHRELPPGSFEEHTIGDFRRHELTEWDDGDLSGDGGDAKRLGPVPEELVEERQKGAGKSSEDPHSEGENRERCIVGGRYSQRHLFDRRILLLLILQHRELRW